MSTTIDSIISYLGNTCVQPGMMQIYAGSTAPSGYLLCKGQAVSRTTYARLFSAIGTTFGAGDGSTTFNLPDMQGKVIVGTGNSTKFTFGNTGGEENHTITETEMPAHTHASTVTMRVKGTDYNNTNVIGTGTYNGTTVTKTADTKNDDAIGQISTKSKGNYLIFTQNTASKGSGTAANNMQPYAVINYIIKV